MPYIENLDFLNQNSLRNYPIKEGAPRISTDGVLTLPNNFIVDFQLAATYDPTRRFFISKISNFEDSMQIEISDENSIVAGTFNITVVSHTPYKEYFLTPTDYYVGATGVIVIDDYTSFNITGVFNFNISNTEFETRTVIPALRGINRLIFTNADGTSYSYTGDVVIEARTNLRFKAGVGNTVILDAGENIGLNTICSDYVGCIKTINGIPGDAEQNFTLDFSDCITLTPIPANTGLLLQDVCCKPCVGCSEIGELTTRLTTTETNLVTLRQYYTDLQQLFEDYKVTVYFPQLA